MKTATKVAQLTLLGSGALLLVLGLIIWTGNGDQLIPVHVVLGSVLVLSLWTLPAIAARAGVSIVPVAADHCPLNREGVCATVLREGGGM